MQTELALIYVLERRNAEAEPLARGAVDALKNKPADDWDRVIAETILGGALEGGKKYAEAEPLLLHGYRVLAAERDRLDAPDRFRIGLAHKWLVQLYRDRASPTRLPSGAEMTSLRFAF